METWKSFFRAVAGLAVLSAYALCLIGATGYLVYDGHVLFALAEVAVSVMAYPSVRNIIVKTLF